MDSGSSLWIRKWEVEFFFFKDGEKKNCDSEILQICPNAHFGWSMALNRGHNFTRKRDEIMKFAAEKRAKLFLREALSISEVLKMRVTARAWKKQTGAAITQQASCSF